MRKAGVPVTVVTVALGICLIAGAAMVATAADVATVRLWNWNVHDKKYQQKMYKLFNQNHPEIKIEYSSIANTVYDQTLEAAITAKDPPEIFLPSGSYGFQKLKDKGLILPLNSCAPSDAELKDWMAQFPTFLRKFVEGINVFDGKVYSVDLRGESWQGGNPLFYNKTLFKEAGIEKPPATYSEFRQTAAKITQSGQGKYFGATLPLKASNGWHMNLWFGLAWSAGVRGDHGEMLWGPDLKDGKWHAGDPAFARALQVWLDLRKDGSVFPGETTMDDETSKMTLATNKAGMQFGGDWNVGNYQSYNPDLDYDLELPPTPDDGINRGYMYSDPMSGGGVGYVVSSSTKNPRAAWEVLKFISGPEYQVGWVQGGYGISYLPEASKKENFSSPQLYKFVEWGNDPTKRHVQPHLSENAQKALSFAPPVYPILRDIVDTVYLGKAGFDALKEWDAKMDAAMEAGIKKAQEAGLKVTRADFAFPDWDPSKDYQPKTK